MPLPNVSLEPRIVFGHRTDVYKNGHYITDSDFVYAVGAMLVFQNLDTNKQRYLNLPDKSPHLSILVVSPSKRLVAALMNEPLRAVIHIYDTMSLKRKRTLSLPPDSTSKEIVSMNFSSDERFVMVITGEPDWMMLVYNWERGKVETSTQANYITSPQSPVREVVCSPIDTSVVAIYGPGLFRQMNLHEAVWRQYGFQKADYFDICSCCFLTADRILCGTTDGLLLFIDIGELKFVFDADVVNCINAKADKDEEFVGAITSAILFERNQAVQDDDTPKKDRGVRGLVTLKNGFAYSCLPGLVHFFEKISPHKYVKRNVYEVTDKDFREDKTHSILIVNHLIPNVTETKLMAATRAGQMYCVKLWGPEMDIAGNVAFKHLWHSTHSGPIKDLDVCYWRPIFMTCGAIDRTVRIWNYETDGLELMKQYQEDIHSVSLHPTGLFAAIGFSDKLRYMVVLIDDLQVSREFPIRECPKSSFSISGNLLAAVNRNIIQIYSVTTFQNLANLKGHSGIIKCLRWTLDNMKLVSCGTDGAIYEWDIHSFKRVGEIVNKGITYLECAIMSNGQNIYTVGSDNYLKEIRASNVLRMVNLNLKDMNHVIVSRTETFMLISITEGIIAAMKMPVGERTEPTLYYLHNTTVSQMKLSLDDRNLISCSVGGTLCIWTVKDPESKLLPPDKQLSLKYFKEILISKNDLEEKMSSIKDLTHRTYELEMEHAYQMRQTETMYTEKMADIQATYTQILDELKATLEVLEANYQTELNNINSDMNIIKEMHEAEMLEMEAKYNADLIIEYNKILDLEALRDRVTVSYEIQLEELQASKDRKIEELTRANESKLYNLNKMVEEARFEVNKEVEQHTAFTKQIEDDNDQEIESLKSKYETALKHARESNFRLQGESGVLKKKILSSEKEIELIQMEIINLMADHEQFKASIRSMEKEILDLKKEISERDLRIQDKEKKIYDLKRKDQEYERYKFVLNYRIKELKKQIEPRDKAIKEKKEHISELEDELDELQKINISLDNRLSAMREKLNEVYKLLRSYKKKYTNVMFVIGHVKNDIYSASANIQDYKKLRGGVKKLYFKYVTDKDFAKTRKGDEECIVELQRQKEYLREIANSLDRDVEASKQIKTGEGMIYMEMNWELMEEIYKMQKLLKVAHVKINDMEMLMCVRLAKNYSPRTAHKLIERALKSDDDLREECEIKMEEATSKALVMREELDILLERIAQIEMAIRQGKDKKNKRHKEGLKFDIPPITTTPD